jgi:oxidoreductase, aldo/keto reductase family protein
LLQKFFPVEEKKNGRGLSRKHIFQPVEQSLKRLDTDYIDLLVIHRWDYDTPIEYTMEALNDLVKSGKVLYIGASAMYAWQFQKAQNIAERNGWTKFISMQNHYNLLYREDKRELLPYCKDANIQLTPYSPLAAGRLTRDWQGDTLRFKTDKESVVKYDGNELANRRIVDRVAALAKEKNVTKTQIALAWLLHQPQVAAPIIGATKITHLEEAIQIFDVELTKEDLKFLEEEYTPHKVVGAL